MVDRKWVADGILEALERADRELRRRHRYLFRRVDRIKRQPGWRPYWENPPDPRKVCKVCGGTAWIVRASRPDHRECRWCANRRARDWKRRHR